ncbi:conserved proline-rich protein [Paecilomyces variotii No. 5]|uniref:Conserved proline-rich protein n=1 Tax=Byssochlamys spectabilis (strain No. 5 / NBRC 109023) TaxID=1356009 RepID=V5FGG3_BYSSN|nr:conserved proline-rich protein [Paecilomyces variotii No. 5]
MSPTKQFQLFPSSSPKRSGAKPSVKTSPRRRTEEQPSSPIALEEITASKDTEAVIFRIIEETNSIQPPQKAHLKSSTSPAHTPEPSLQSVPVEPQDGRRAERTISPELRTPNSISTTLIASSVGAPQHLTASHRSGSRSPESPFVPIRSIFPRYNPDVPLSKQNYYPVDIDRVNIHHESVSRGQCIPAVSQPAEIDSVLGPKTVPASVMNFPDDSLDNTTINYSSAEDLEVLWEIANGQRHQNVVSTFNLQVARVDSATFTFGDPHVPFYAMQTFSANELAITRTYPRKPSRSVPVMMLNLENKGRRQPPNDGLLALIFSRLAAMLAVDQAAELSRQHRLAPTEAVEVETDAIRRAVAHESCRLVWNESQKRYELRHPALAKRKIAALVGHDGIPLSPVQTRDPGTLHITVYRPSESGNGVRQPPIIMVTNPVSATAVEAAHLAASPRTSTLPLTDIDDPLASLDFGTMTLSISAGLIAATVPSLYAVDSLVAAILVVAVSDEATSHMLADMEIYGSYRHPHRNSIVSAASSNTRYTGRFFATIAERDDTKDEVNPVSNSKSTKSKKTGENRRSPRFWGRSKSKKKQIVIDEIDLEKYGRYGKGSSREGEKLPGSIRAFLRFMFWSLELVVRGLTVTAKVFAWLLVHLTRCVTSEKF